MSEKIAVKMTNILPPITMNPPEPTSVPISMDKVVPMYVSGSVGFTWNQTTPLAIWTIPHNLNKYPSVTVCDTQGSIIYQDVKYLDNNTVQITHGSAFAGKAYLN